MRCRCSNAGIRTRICGAADGHQSRIDVGMLGLQRLSCRVLLLLLLQLREPLLHARDIHGAHGEINDGALQSCGRGEQIVAESFGHDAGLRGEEAQQS